MRAGALRRVRDVIGRMQAAAPTCRPRPEEAPVMMAVFFLPPGSLPPLSMRANTSALPGFSGPPTATWSLALTNTPAFLTVSAYTMTRSEREVRLHVGATEEKGRDEDAREFSVAPGQRCMVAFISSLAVRILIPDLDQGGACRVDFSALAHACARCRQTWVPAGHPLTSLVDVCPWENAAR
jgi:hypothetical protein